MMTCDVVRKRLDDYVDGELSPGERLEVAEHLAGCPDCRTEVERTEALERQAAALPKCIEPEVDLWPAIARELRTPGRSLAARGRQGWPAMIWVGLAAAAALMATVGLTLLVTRRVPPQPGSMVGASLASGGVSVEAQLMEIAGGEELAVARASLRKALEARRGELSPATWTVVEKNLQVIEAAADEIAVALAKDPGNRELRSLLVVAYQQQVELLRQAVSLPAGG